MVFHKSHAATSSCLAEKIYEVVHGMLDFALVCWPEDEVKGYFSDVSTFGFLIYVLGTRRPRIAFLPCLVSFGVLICHKPKVAKLVTQTTGLCK